MNGRTESKHLHGSGNSRGSMDTSSRGEALLLATHSGPLPIRLTRAFRRSPFILPAPTFTACFTPGGAFSLYSALSWAWRSHGNKDQTDWPSAADVNRASNGFPLEDADRRAIGADVPFFKDWVNHPNRDSYWAEIDGTGRTQSLSAPILLIAGWYDPFLPTQLNDFVEIRRSASSDVAAQSRLIIGPWTHASEVTFPDGTRAENFRRKSLAVSLPWFDEHSGLTAIAGHNGCAGEDFCNGEE